MVYKWLFLGLFLLLSGCFYIPADPNYAGPTPRSPKIEEYYGVGKSYGDFTQDITATHKRYQIKRIVLNSAAGNITLDFYQRHETSDDLILVFPMLGGKKNIIVDYFAHYFAERGFDAAIIHRVDDFKDPKRFDDLEELLRQNVIRDRVAIDFFEREYQKKDFGSFGLSRGAINVAMTAGVEPRLKFNVMALGASDIPKVLKHSNQRRIKMYRDTVMQDKQISEDEFFRQLHARIVTDPKNLASHIDARNTLLFLSLFDRTVPIRYGHKLRKDLGKPKTFYILADHYVGIVFTQYVKLLPVTDELALFPIDFIESESLEFYRKSFRNGSMRLWRLPLKIIRAPFDLIGSIVGAFAN